MSAQSLESYNREGTGWVSQPTYVCERGIRTCLPLQNVGIRLRSRSFVNSPETRSFA